MTTNPTSTRLRHSTLGLACVAALGLTGPLAAATVGYYTDDYFLTNTGNTGPAAPITASGNTPVHITDITTFDSKTHVDKCLANGA